MQRLRKIKINQSGRKFDRGTARILSTATPPYQLLRPPTLDNGSGGGDVDENDDDDDHDDGNYFVE
jgi:hypothetical protein